MGESGVTERFGDMRRHYLAHISVRVIDCARYMDDVRVWLRAIRLGWRWLEGQLVYRRCWRMEEEENGMTPLSKTTEIMKGMMHSI